MRAVLEPSTRPSTGAGIAPTAATAACAPASNDTGLGPSAPPAVYASNKVVPLPGQPQQMPTKQLSAATAKGELSGAAPVRRTHSVTGKLMMAATEHLR
jgi:hypothetical protein